MNEILIWMNSPRQAQILIFAPSYPPGFLAGGPGRTLEALVAKLPSEIPALVIAPDRDLHQNKTLNVTKNSWVKTYYSHVIYVNPNSVLNMLRAFLLSRAEKPKVVYLNSFFHPTFSLVPLILWSARFWGDSKVLIAPRGEFDQDALSSKRRLKQLIVHLVMGSNKFSKIWWHASNQREANQFKAVGISSGRILIREDETLLHEIATFKSRKSNKLKLIFLSRIIENKGLDLVLGSLLKVKTPVALDIFGPVESTAYFEKCEKLIEQIANHTPHQVVYRGVVTPSEVTNTFSKYDAFVFPTAFENFGHVIAEAMSVSCLIVCPDTTPWTTAIKSGGGFIINRTDTSMLAKTIDELAALSLEHRNSLRKQVGTIYENWAKHNQELSAVESLLLAKYSNKGEL